MVVAEYQLPRQAVTGASSTAGLLPAAAVPEPSDRAELLDRVAKLEDRVDRLEELLMAQKGNPDEVGGR